jgi:hypothetical protein
MRAGSIIITGGQGATRELSLNGGCLRIGSAPDNDLVVAGPDIAPHHATVICDDRGRLIVEISAENLVGQGGMRLTFNLAHANRRRDLAWIGDYIISYQPPRWSHLTQPLSLADLPGDTAALPDTAPVACPSADDTTLLHTLLKQSLAWQPRDEASHEAATMSLPLMLLSSAME